MSDEHAPTTGISSRRSACDRCRTQKSKCLRQHPDQTRCDRCTHADSECVTSPIYRMRAWQATPDSFSDGSSVSSLRGQGTFTRKRQRQEHHYQQLLTPSEANSTSKLGVSGDFPCDNAPHEFNDNGFPSFAYGCVHQSPPRPIQDQALKITGLFDSIFDDVVMDQYIESVPGISNEPIASIALPRVDTEAPDSLNPSTRVVAARDEDKPLQQLSRIDYDLITLLGCLAKGSPEISMNTLVSPIDAKKSSTPAVDDILNRTREFVDILELLSEQYSPLNDTATLVAILSSYLRVLRLYVIIFAHIHDFLKDISESDDTALCPIPGLSFCTFPIQSGNLQTIILIQVVTNLWERIEVLLGLPREFRLGTRREENLGLFRANGFMDIASPIMRKEEEGNPYLGKGGIKCLREMIKKTKHLLRDGIAP